MQHRLVVVKAVYDHEAAVWYVESSDIDGLNAEAATIEDLLKVLPLAVADLLDEEDPTRSGERADVPIELIAHASLRTQRTAA
jgi:hypothetical protein